MGNPGPPPFGVPSPGRRRLYAPPPVASGSQTARMPARVSIHVRKPPVEPAPLAPRDAPPLDEEAPPPSPAAITPALALKRHLPQLTEFEKGEILAYSSVWYCGQAASKLPATFAQASNNHGYDDERGDYKVVMRDHIGYRYEVVSALGKGSFGQVVKCIDHKTQQLIAVKLIRNKKRFHQQALVEVKILEYLKSHDAGETSHAIRFAECFYFRAHLCITFELMSLNLYEFIKANNFQGVSLPLIRRFATQLLATLRFLRAHRIIHCDLKPENVLLKHPSKSGIKVIDFGSSCFEDQRMYTYIQSRFYRAPEVMLGLPYHCAIDMWSFGCILAELCTGYPLFPGENEREQLACTMEVLGPPPRRLVEASSRAATFFEPDGSAKLVVNSRGKERRPGTRTLQAALRCADAPFLDFLEGCLRWNAAERFTPDDALRHPFIASLQGLQPPQPQPPVTAAAPTRSPLAARANAAGAGAAGSGSIRRRSLEGYASTALQPPGQQPPLPPGPPLGVHPLAQPLFKPQPPEQPRADASASQLLLPMPPAHKPQPQQALFPTSPNKRRVQAMSLRYSSDSVHIPVDGDGMPLHYGQPRLPQSQPQQPPQPPPALPVIVIDAPAAPPPPPQPADGSLGGSGGGAAGGGGGAAGGSAHPAAFRRVSKAQELLAQQRNQTAARRQPVVRRPSLLAPGAPGDDSDGGGAGGRGAVPPLALAAVSAQPPFAHADAAPCGGGALTDRGANGDEYSTRRLNPPTDSIGAYRHYHLEPVSQKPFPRGGPMHAAGSQTDRGARAQLAHEGARAWQLAHEHVRMRPDLDSLEEGTAHLALRPVEGDVRASASAQYLGARPPLPEHARSFQVDRPPQSGGAESRESSAAATYRADAPSSMMRPQVTHAVNGQTPLLPRIGAQAAALAASHDDVGAAQIFRRPMAAHAHLHPAGVGQPVFRREQKS